MKRLNNFEIDSNNNIGVAENLNKNTEKLTYYKELKLGPIERYIKLGIFPWKMIVQILLVIFTISQCLLIINKMTNYSRAQERGLYNIFIDDSDKLDDDYVRNIYIFSVEETRNHVANSINNYYNIHDFTLDNVELPPKKPSPVLEFSFIDNNMIRYNMTEENYFIPENTRKIERNLFYKINNNTLGPFDYDDESLKQFLNAVVYFKINYTLFSYTPYIYGDNTECSEWNIMQTFDFSSRIHFICTVEFTNKECGENTRLISSMENFMDRLLWIHLVVLNLAIISLVLTWRSISNLINLYMRVKLRRKREVLPNYKSSSDDSIYYNPLLDTLSSEEELIKRGNKFKKDLSILNIGDNEFRKESYLKKPLNGRDNQEILKTHKIKREPKKHLQILQLWSVLGLIGNLIQIMGAGLALSQPSDVTTNITILIGSGCLFSCINIGKYIEYHKDYAIVYETLKRSFPVVIRFLIGAFPIFLGFLFFSVSIFWRSDRFSSTSIASYSLFAIIQGDAVYSTFKDLSGIRFFLGQIFLYLFCIVFIIIVWNVFVCIIEEAYVVTKLRNKTSWIYNYVNIEPKYVKMTIHSQPSLELTRKYFTNMKKTSEMLKKKISKSLMSNDKLKNKNKEVSLVASSPSIGNSLFNQSHKPSSFILGKRDHRKCNIIVESIPERDEFLLSKEGSSKKLNKKESFGYTKAELEEIQKKNKENQIESIFVGLEKRFEKIQKMIIDLSQNKKTIPIIIRLRKDKIKKTLLSKVNLIENKADELRRVWIGD